MINIIAALDEKRGIGKNGKIPWHISEDFKRFKKITMGHPIIMGRKTYESIGRILPGRTNIVITQNPDYKIQDSATQGQALRGYVVNSLEEAVEIAKKIEKESTPLRQGSEGQGEIFIICGGQIFKEAIEKSSVRR